MEEEIHLNPRLLPKIKCFNCGKNFNSSQNEEYQRILRVNSILREIDLEKLKGGKYSPDDIRIFSLQIQTKAGTDMNSDFEFSTLLRELRMALHEKNYIRQKEILIQMAENFTLRPFDLLKETEAGMEDVAFVNNNEKILKGLGFRRLCCKMHFQTPYMLSQGLTNQIIPMSISGDPQAGLRNQQNSVRPAFRKVDDALEMMQGNYAEKDAMDRQHVRTKKTKEQFITPSEAEKMPNVGNVEEKTNFERRRKEAELKRLAETNKLDMQAFMDEILPMGGEGGEVEEEEVVNEEQEYERTALGKMYEGRLEIPVQKVLKIRKNKGRGRPKKE